MPSSRVASRRIAGAGLDVWYRYPAAGENGLPSRQPFHELENVIMTPHKPTGETMAYRWREIALNIERFARGEKLQRVVYPTSENSRFFIMILVILSPSPPNIPRCRPASRRPLPFLAG